MSSLPFIPAPDAHVDVILVTLSSSFTMIGCLFTIFFYIYFKEFREFNLKLVFILTINDLIISIIFIAATHLNREYNTYIIEKIPFICSVPDTILHYLFISSFFLSASIAHTLLQVIKHNNINVEKYYKYYHLVSWGVPFLLITSLFIARATTHANCKTYSEIYPHLLFFIPLLACWVYNMFVCIQVTTTLNGGGDKTLQNRSINYNVNSLGKGFSKSNLNNSNQINNSFSTINYYFNNQSNSTNSTTTTRYQDSSTSKNVIVVSEPRPLGGKKRDFENSFEDIILASNRDDFTPQIIRTSRLFLISFAVCWIWSLVVVFILTMGYSDSKLLSPILTISYFFFPLQGFLNSLIYGLHDELRHSIGIYIKQFWKSKITKSAPATINENDQEQKTRLLYVPNYEDEQDPDEIDCNQSLLKQQQQQEDEIQQHHVNMYN